MDSFLHIHAEVGRPFEFLRARNSMRMVSLLLGMVFIKLEISCRGDRRIAQLLQHRLQPKGLCAPARMKSFAGDPSAANNSSK
jgi:hypothetical protein